MPPLAAVPDLERELDALYALPLDAFTKARNDLAARLKKAHQEEAAAAVRALRKPSVVAGAANALARSEPKLVASLLQAGDHLRDVQQRALAGEGDQGDVSDAAAAERDAIRRLVTAARELLGTPAALDRLAQTLRAAAVDPAARPLLERGRLTEELNAVGFGPLEAVTPKPARQRDDEVRRAARERVNQLRAEARRLDGEAREAENAAVTLADEAARKRADADRVAAELAGAEGELRGRKD
jgi:hypothetical protein